jgi:hypothetical protein
MSYSFLNPLLDFGEARIDKNGRRATCRKAIYLNFVFQYYPDSRYMVLSGSLHTFYNDAKNNANDFDVGAFYEVLKRMFDLFGLSPQHLTITQLEWGVNLQKFEGFFDCIVFNFN